MSKWVLLYNNDTGKELLYISTKGLAFGEVKATIELLAHEKGLDPMDISYVLTDKRKGVRDA